jgi:hypothetical protein
LAESFSSGWLSANVEADKLIAQLSAGLAIGDEHGFFDGKYRLESTQVELLFNMAQIEMRDRIAQLCDEMAMEIDRNGNLVIRNRAALDIAKVIRAINLDAQ